MNTTTKAKMLKSLMALMMFLSPLALLNAQEAAKKVWTLNECIDYARNNNIQVQSQQVNKEMADQTLEQSKAAMRPTLNFSSSFNLNLSNTATYNDYNEASDALSYSDRFSLNSSLNLYSGGRLRKTVRQNELSSQASAFDVEQSKMDIEISVTQAYLQLLYAKESLRVAELAAELSKKQEDRGTIMRQAGSISKGDLAQLQSQSASDNYQVTTARNSLSNARLQLKQLLELELTDSFDVFYPDIADERVLTPIPLLEDVYNTAMETLPQLKSSQLSVQAAMQGIDIAESSQYPSISMSAGLSTGTNNTNNLGYLDQLGKKMNESVGLSLSIPIFNSKQVRTNISKAKLSGTSTQLQDLTYRKQLLSTIESLHNDAVSAQSQFLSSKEQLNAANISYQIVSEQFNAGLKNVIELITEENNYANALINQIQAKYQAVLSLKLLYVYMNEPIELN